MGNACGTINSNGFYTAPNVAPSPAKVTVTATSLMDLSQSGTATVTIAGAAVVSVSLSPQQITIPLGSQQAFTPTVTGSANTAVTWGLSGYGCTGTACGTITSAGLYTAPKVMPTPGIVFVTATSNADSTKSATSTVYFTSTVNVSVSPSSITLTLGSSKQFSATVTGTANTAVNWTLSGTGCTGTACGMITSAGLYTAPKNAPTPPTVSVTATSQADTSAFASAIVTIQVPLGITVSPTAASVVAGGQIPFSATVVGTTNTAVNWSVSGTGCTGTACGTISSAGVYTAPASIATQMNVTVKATTQATPSVSANATVTVLVSNNGKLAGHYAFLFSGFNAAGAYKEAGSIDANGKGVILSGTEDVNDSINPSPNMSITGTYGVTSDNRGTLTLKSPLGTQTFCIALTPSGTSGKLISCDQSGIRGAGVIYLQDATAFNTTALMNGYVMSLTGATSGGERVGALGLIFPDGTSFVAGAGLDANEGGDIPPTFPSFSGTYAVNANGRGTMTLSIPGFYGGTLDFAVYVVSQEKLLLISMDPLSLLSPIFSGPAVIQSGAPFDETSFSGGSVFSLSGLLNGKSDNTVGLLTFESTGVVQINDDRNAAGTISLGQVGSGAYDLEISGRGDINLDNGNAWVFYATAPNQGFIMDTSDEVLMGQLLPQVPMALDNSTLINTYALGPDDPLQRISTLYSGSISFDGGNSNLGNGTVSGTLDISQISGLSLDKALQGTYSISLVSANGHGFVQLTAPQKMTLSIWLAGPLQTVGLEVDAGLAYTTVLDIDQ